MSDVIDRPILAEEEAARSRLRIIDCDVHPSIHAHTDLDQFLPKRWQQHLRTYGSHLRTPYIGTTPYPRSSPLIARRDAWPPTGGPPGSDLDFMRKQHLDPLDVEFGTLQVLGLFILDRKSTRLNSSHEWSSYAVFCSKKIKQRHRPGHGRSGRFGASVGPRLPPVEGRAALASWWRHLRGLRPRLSVFFF